MVNIFSFEVMNGTVTISLYPFEAAICAIAMAVFPPEASQIVPPGFRVPSFSASSIIDSAGLALILSPVFSNSHFPYILHPVKFDNDYICTRVVLPIFKAFYSSSIYISSFTFFNSTSIFSYYLILSIRASFSRLISLDISPYLFLDSSVLSTKLFHVAFLAKPS